MSVSTVHVYSISNDISNHAYDFKTETLERLSFCNFKTEIELVIKSDKLLGYP